MKPFAKKALQSGVSHAGEKVGKMAAEKAIEKSGDLIRKRFSKKSGKGKKNSEKRKEPPRNEIARMINNNNKGLISVYPCYGSSPDIKLKRGN